MEMPLTLNQICSFFGNKNTVYKISEALRLWPPVVSTDRMCNRNYHLPPPDNNSNQQYEV